MQAVCGIIVVKHFALRVHVQGMYASHRTALHAAAEAGHVTVVQYLLRHGADIEMRNWVRSSLW